MDLKSHSQESSLSGITANSELQTSESENDWVTLEVNFTKRAVRHIPNAEYYQSEASKAPRDERTMVPPSMPNSSSQISFLSDHSHSVISSK